MVARIWSPGGARRKIGSGAESGGRVSVMYAPPGGVFDPATAQDWNLEGHFANTDASWTWFGWSVASGDFTGDGIADLAVGASASGVAGLEQDGAVYLLLGSPGGLIETSVVLTQDTPGVPGVQESLDAFGMEEIAAARLGGGSRDWLVIGAPCEKLGRRTCAGAVTVVPGSATGLDTAGSSQWTQARPGVRGIAERFDVFGTGRGDRAATGSKRGQDGGDTMTKFCGTVTAVTAALLMLIPVSAGQATSAQPGPLATPSLSLGLLGVAEISHDGRWLLGGSATSDGAIILDRDTGTGRGVESSDVDPSEFRGFVRDNPVLELTVKADPDWRGAFLTNSSTAKRKRIDTSSKGVPLTPKWRSTCDDECADTDKPDVYLTAESIHQRAQGGVLRRSRRPTQAHPLPQGPHNRSTDARTKLVWRAPVGRRRPGDPAADVRQRSGRARQG